MVKARVVSPLFSYDVGALYYYYPGDVVAGTKNTNSAEVYGSLGWKFISLKYSHAASTIFFGWYSTTTSKSSRNSGYLDLSANYDLGAGWGINGHVGHQTIRRAASHRLEARLSAKDIWFR